MGKTVSITPKGGTKGRSTGRTGSSSRRKRGSSWRDYLIAVAVAALLAVVVKTFLVQAFRVPSRSMEDSLLAGDYLLVDKVTFGPQLPGTDWHLPALSPLQTGDVVLFRYPLDTERIYVKRCVATAGQVVELRNKVLYVDGVRSQDPPYSKFLDAHIFTAAQNRRDNFGPLEVPDGHIFVLGDNRDNSRDSRHWGALSTHLVIGRTLWIYWSCELPSPAVRQTGAPGSSPVEAITRSAISRVRWSRLGSQVR
jgi:signal peptidase I